MSRKKKDPHRKKKCCPVCGSRDVIGKGRANGNWGKKQFECGSCGNFWQFGW